MDNKKTKEERKFYDCLFEDSDLVFSRIGRFLVDKKREKIAKLKNGLKLINNFKIHNFFSEEIKVTAAIVFIIMSIIWMRNREIIPIAHSDDFDSKITNAQSVEKSESEKLELEEKEIDVKSINRYKLESSDKECEDNKSKKRSSDLCGKDDEEELEKIAKEKAAKIAKASKPRVVKPSCGEDDEGDPSRSKTKGKHRDEDCCPDPDEWPKPGCVYSAKGYSIMLKGPKK